MIETQFVAFFAVLLVAVLFSSLFSRFNIPWAVTLILGGIIVGPNVLDWLQPDSTIMFMAEVGAVFLMFMAGLETPLSSFKNSAYKVTAMALVNGAVPFIIGVMIGHLFGFSFLVSILIGIIFISSSVAVVVPTLDRNKLLNTPLGHIIIGSTVIQDVTSLVLISVFLQFTNPITSLPLPLFYILIFLIIILLYKIIGWIKKYLLVEGKFHQEFRFAIVILSGVVVIFSLLGLHHIIAGFFTGFVLSETLQNNKLKNSLHTVGYGIFIPIFFVLIGFNTDLSVFINQSSTLPLVIVLVSGLILSKFVSGYVAARFERFNRDDSLLIAITSIPQLATTLAVVYTAFTQGIITQDLVTAFVILSITTTVLTPIITQLLLRKRSRQLLPHE